MSNDAFRAKATATGGLEGVPAPTSALEMRILMAGCDWLGHCQRAACWIFVVAPATSWFSTGSSDSRRIIGGPFDRVTRESAG